MSLLSNSIIVQRRDLPRPVVDPVVDLGVPEQAVLLVQHPMALVWEVQESAWYTKLLKGVEHCETLANRQAEVQIIMYDELWSCELLCEP
jgi:hypothetical protein